MECLSKGIQNLKLTNSPGGSHLLRDGEEFVRLEDKIVKESSGSIKEKNQPLLKCKNEESNSIEDENELIPRGPTSRTKYRSHPYPQSYDSPSSCSESSQDSPLSYNNDRCPLSGGSFIINIESSLENLNTEENVFPSNVPEKRHTYIHKAGGKFQVVNHNSQVIHRISLSKLCFNASNSVTNTEYGKDKMSSNLPGYSRDFKDQNFGSEIFGDVLKDDYSASEASLNSFSPLSQNSGAFSSDNLSVLSPEVLSSDASVNGFDHFSVSDEDSPVNNDLPEDLENFILEENNNVSELNPSLLRKYSETISDLLEHENYPPETTSLLNTAKEIPNEHRDSHLPLLIPSVVSNVSKSSPVVDQENNLKNYSVAQPLVKNVYLLTPTYVFVKPAENKFRPLAPKPTSPKETVVNTSTLATFVKSMSEDDQTEALRASILSRFSEDEKRTRHCEITKISDENIVKTFDDGDSDTLLHISIFKNILTSVYLIDRYAKLSALDVLNEAGETPLLNAVNTQQTELMKYLLYKGANPNACILKNGSTIVHYVAQRGKLYLEALEILCCCSRTDVNIYNSEGRTPLMNAVDNHEKEIKLNNPDNAVVIDSFPTIRVLLKYGASVSCQHRCNGKTIFHMAVEKKNLQLLQFLCCEIKAVRDEINSKMFDGNTPLHLVGAMNDCDVQLRINIIGLLLKHGASLKATNQCNKTPADLVDKHWKEIKRLLTPSRHP